MLYQGAVHTLEQQLKAQDVKNKLLFIFFFKSEKCKLP